jgi:uncharacterized protein
VLTFSVLTLTAFIAGVVNALAGGGSLVTFPALLFAGLNPIGANASSMVALMPATISSVWAYRHRIRAIKAIDMRGLLWLSLIGGLFGAVLLLITPSAVFAGLVPWLMLFSTLTFAVGNILPVETIGRLKLNRPAVLVIHFVISLYGGYFGGGIGFLMLAALTLFGMRDINEMNGLKLLLVGVMTLVSMITFIVAGIVHWPETLPMLVSSTIGGYVGAHWAQKVDQRLIKAFVVVLGAGLTAYFFWRGV